MQNKMKALTLVLTLLLSSLSLLFTPPLLLVPLVYGSTGTPALGAVNSTIAIPYNVSIASYNVSIPAGSMNVSEIDGEAPTVSPAYFAIFFYKNSSLVTFSGAQFDLYISKDGYSAISDDDKMYAGSFYVADLDAEYPKKVHIKNRLLKDGEADFYMGTFIPKSPADNTTYKVLVGPIPFEITSDYKYIKVFDGTSTAVAVTVQTVKILPSLVLTPTEGPGGATVTLKGTALLPNELINITYKEPLEIAGLIKQMSTDDMGKFSYNWSIKDLGKEFVGVNTTIPSDSITIEVLYNATGEVVGEVTYSEYRRAFLQVDDIIATPGLGYGNHSVTVSVGIYSDLIVAGNYFNPTDSVTFTVEGIPVGSATPNSTGFFNVTLTVPELAKGTHDVEVLNAEVLYTFTIDVQPTLKLEPKKGPVETRVYCYAYGFDPDIAVYIYWFEKSYGDSTYYNLVNATTGSDGKFNVTVSFIVPHTYGGDHIVAADRGFVEAEKKTLTSSIANATFTVTPTLWIEPSEFSNDGSLVSVTGTGLDPRVGYTPNIDNNLLGVDQLSRNCSTSVYANATGDLIIKFVAAGFRPGLHCFSLYPNGTLVPVYATFTVTTEGDPIIDFLISMNATIVDIKGEVAIIETTVGNLSVSLDAIDAKIVDLDGDVATISTVLGEVKTSVGEIVDSIESVGNGVVEIKTKVGTIEGKVISIDDGVAVIRTDVGDVKADVSTIKGNTETIPDAISAVTTPIWIAVILSLIAAIAAIASVVTITRKIAG